MKPPKCQIGNDIASGGLKWQYIAIIATFSSFKIISAFVDVRQK